MKLATMLALLAALLSIGCNVYVPPTVPLAPAGARVTADVESGYRNYARPLAAAGNWEPDAHYGAHWCPNGVGRDFVPFASRGHWAISSRKIGSAPAGVPTWQSHDASWGDITYHHGFWARTDTARPSPWCWIPGVEETPARVVWRVGGGFVGWAPEEPDTRVDDDVDFEGLDWMYQLVASLLEPDLGGGTLRGPARNMAEYATWRAPVHHVAHVGPSRGEIARAVRALEGYRSAHPEAVASTSDASEHANGGGGASAAKGSGGTSISGGSSGGGHAAKVSIGNVSSSGNVKIVQVGPFKIAIVSNVYAMPPLGLPLDLPPPEYMMAGVDPGRAVLVERPVDARLPGSAVGDRYAASRVGGGSDGGGGSLGRGIAARHGSHGGSHAHASGHHASTGSSHGNGWSFGHGAFHFHR